MEIGVRQRYLSVYIVVAFGGMVTTRVFCCGSRFRADPASDLPNRLRITLVQNP